MTANKLKLLERLKDEINMSVGLDMKFKTMKDLYEFICKQKSQGEQRWHGIDINFCLKYCKPVEVPPVKVETGELFA